VRVRVVRACVPVKGAPSHGLMPLRLLTETQIAAVRQARLHASTAPPTLSDEEEQRRGPSQHYHHHHHHHPQHDTQHDTQPPGAALAHLLAWTWTWTVSCIVSFATTAKAAAMWAWHCARSKTAPEHESPADGAYVKLATSSRESGSPSSAIPDASDEDLNAVSRHVSIFDISRIR